MSLVVLCLLASSNSLLSVQRGDVKERMEKEQNNEFQSQLRYRLQRSRFMHSFTSCVLTPSDSEKIRLYNDFLAGGRVVVAEMLLQAVKLAI